MNSILQTKQWAEFKKSQGLEVIELDGIFVHKKPTPLGQNFLYVPEASADVVSAQHIDELKKLVKEQNSIFLRLELVDKYNDNAKGMMGSFGFQKAFEQVQPKWRQIIDLRPSEEEILAQMKQKGRYNVRLAEKKGVKIQSSNLKNQNDNEKSKLLEEFYRLYSQTNQREHLGGRSLGYFQKMLESFATTDPSESDSAEAGYLEVYVAYLGDEPLAGAVISFYDGMASYLYGGSSRTHREAMAPHLMHWQIIRDAKARGMQSYDLIGRSKPGDEQSRWAGVTRFKEQLGGAAVEVLGSYDFVNKPMWYKLFRFAEKMRRKSS